MKLTKNDINTIIASLEFQIATIKEFQLDPSGIDICKRLIKGFRELPEGHSTIDVIDPTYRDISKIIKYIEGVGCYYYEPLMETYFKLEGSKKIQTGEAKMKDKDNKTVNVIPLCTLNLHRYMQEQELQVEPKMFKQSYRLYYRDNGKFIVTKHFKTDSKNYDTILEYDYDLSHDTYFKIIPTLDILKSLNNNIKDLYQIAENKMIQTTKEKLITCKEYKFPQIKL